MAEAETAPTGMGLTPSAQKQLEKDNGARATMSDYRNGNKVIGHVKTNGNKTQKMQADTMGKAIDMGIISNRTGADAVTYEGTNPFAVSQLSEDMFIQFRRRAMGLIISQSIFVNLIAFMIDRFAPLPEFHWGMYLATWAVPVVLLFILSWVRYKTPCNFVMLFIFSVAVGITFGFLHEPMKAYTDNFASNREKNFSPQCYGMAGHTLALILLSLLTCFKHPGRQPGRGLVKMAPVSIVVAVVTDLAGIVAYQTHWNYVGPPLFIGIALLMNTLSLAWIGYQMDVLALRLKFEEWIYPLILLWCEVFVTLFVIMVFLFTVCLVLTGAGDGGADAGGASSGTCDGCYGFYCDCYYGGSSERKATEDEATVPADAPSQDQMVGTVDV